MMTLIIQNWIEVVPINMHLMLTLNHTSEACISQTHLSHYYAGFTRYNFWKFFLFFFWICIARFPASSLATMPNSREMRNCSQSSRCCCSRQDFRIHPTALGFPLLSVCVSALHQPTATSSTKSRLPKAGVTLQWTRPLTPRWEISEHQTRISSPIRVAAKKGSAAWDLERLSPLIPWRKSESRKRDQHCAGILADGYKIFWQVVCLALIGKYL